MTPPLVTVVGTSKGAPGGGVITSYPPPLSPILLSPARNTNNHRDQARVQGTLLNGDPQPPFVMEMQKWLKNIRKMDKDG